MKFQRIDGQATLELTQKDLTDAICGFMEKNLSREDILSISGLRFESYDKRLLGQPFMLIWEAPQ